MQLSPVIVRHFVKIVLRFPNLPGQVVSHKETSIIIPQGYIASYNFKASELIQRKSFKKQNTSRKPSHSAVFAAT